MTLYKALIPATGLLLWALGAGAAEPPADPGYITQATISGNAMSGTRGRLAVNQAAGDVNQQVNAAAIAVNPDGLAMARTDISQQIQPGQANPPAFASTRIEGTAFSNAVGLISINQTAGVANAQQNTAAVSIGQFGGWQATELDESNLAHTTASTGTPEETETVSEVAIGPDAFQAARGVIQVNQVAGNGNATANRIYLHLNTGAMQ